jgi:hypothetical protein
MTAAVHLFVVAAFLSPVAGAQAPQNLTIGGSDIAIWNAVGSVRLEAGTATDVQDPEPPDRSTSIAGRARSA